MSVRRKKWLPSPRPAVPHDHIAGERKSIWRRPGTWLKEWGVYQRLLNTFFLHPGRWTALACCILLILVLVNGFIAFQQIQTLVDREHAVGHSQRVLSALERLLITLDDAETSQRGYVLTGQESYLQPYTRARAQIPRQLDQLQALTAGSKSQQRLLTTLRALVMTRLKELEQAIDLRNENQIDAAIGLVLTGRGRQTMDQIRVVTDQMIDAEESTLDRGRASAQASLNETRVTVLLATLADVVLLLVIFWLFRRALAQRERLAAERASLLTQAQLERARLHAVLDVMPAGVSVMDASGRVLEMNAAMRALRGETAPLVGDASEDGHTQDRQAATGEPLAARDWTVTRVLRIGEAITGEEVEVETPGGQRKVALCSAVPLHDERGAVIGGVEVMVDITERKRIEEELARLLESEQQARAEAVARARELETVFEAMTDGLVVYDAEGQMLRMNTAGRRIVGGPHDIDAYFPLTQEQRVLRLNVRDANGQPLPPEQLPSARALRGEALTGENAPDILIRMPDGRDVLINSSTAPLRDAGGHIVGVISVFRDVTERRQLERRTHEALDALLEMASALVSREGEQSEGVVPITASLSRANPVARRLAELTCRVLGCSRVGIMALEPGTDTLCPVTVVGLSPEQERQWWATQSQENRLSQIGVPGLSERLFAGEAVLIDMTQPPLNERPNPYGVRQMLVVPMPIERQLVGLLALDYGGAEHAYTAQEIALAGAVAQLAALVIERERLLHERAEAEANALALREANRQMDAFMSMASHELKTPLTSVKLHLQLAQRRVRGLLSRQTVSLDEMRRALDQLQEQFLRSQLQVQRLDRLVNDLLDISRIQSDRLEIRPESADLAVIVRDAVEDQRQLAKTRTISLHPLPEQGVPVVADAGRIGQVVMNYLTNALKYSPEHQPVEVGVEVEEHQARVWVRDQGPGLSPDEQTHIWERFYRAKGIEVQSGSGIGLGLGLYISRTIIQTHRGQVGVQSAPGQGSTFWFSLPLARAGG